MAEPRPAAPTPVDRTTTIAIITHALQDLRPGTTIARIAHEHWVEKGYRIVTHRGLDRLPPADVAIQHVDLTRVPWAYLQLARHYTRVINGLATFPRSGCPRSCWARAPLMTDR